METPTDLDWLTAVEPTVDVEPSPVGSGRVDFVAGAALAGINLFVSAALILVWVLRTAGIVVSTFLNQEPSSVVESPAAFAIVVTGSLLGLAIGVGGFALFAFRRWTSYYWPLFGMAIALGSSIVASRS